MAYINPDDYSIPKDGVTDSTSAWNTLIAAISDKSVIILPANANYLLNTSGGLTFNKTVHIIGAGSKFTCGSSVGNNPTLTFSSDKSILDGFEVDCESNHTDGLDDKFESVDLSTNLRRGILITGDYVNCRHLLLTNCVIGISFYYGHNGNVDGCILINSIVTSGDSTVYNNYHAGVHLNYSNNVVIKACTISGHGQNVTVGSSYRTVICDNILSGASNNGIYHSSGSDAHIHNNLISSFDDTGIKARGSRHVIHGNRIQCDIDGGASAGISITGRGDADDYGFNGYDTIASENIITGDALYGIVIAGYDDGHFKNAHIINNLCDFDESPTKSCLGIQFRTTAANGAIIKGNRATGGFSYGLWMSAATGYTLKNCTIADNNFVGGSNIPFTLSDVNNSIISGNMGKNSSGQAGCYVQRCGGNLFTGNNFGDDQDEATQTYGVQEYDCDDYGGNWYINNYCSGVISSAFYDLSDDAILVDQWDSTGGNSMSITIDATACGEDSNSYCTLSEVDAYMLGIPWFASTWAALTTATKNAWLVFATRAIDRLKFKGASYDVDQALEFPRTITDDKTDEGYIPQKVKDAQCELIIWLYNHISSDDGSPEEQVERVSVGRGALDIIFKKYGSNNKNLAGGYPEAAKSLLAHWLYSDSSFSTVRG